MKLFNQIPVINCVPTSTGVNGKSFDDRILYFMELIAKSKKHGDKVFIIDDEDYESIRHYTPNVRKTTTSFYINLKYKEDSHALHRFLLNAPYGIEVDHKNRNGLDNRRCNLRLATKAQNRYNSFDEKKSASGFKGVYWAKEKNMWCTRITHNDKVIQGGYFKCKIDAAHRYNELAIECFKEFAYLNTFTQEQLDARLNEPRWGNGIKRCKTGYRGVSEMNGRYIAHIRKAGKKTHIGCYGSAKEAAIAYNEEAILYFGENTYLNKI
jgi:hypothetical protein